MNKQQDILRKKIKISKIYDDDFPSYSQLSDMLDIKINSFYNWLNSAYDLGYQKYNQLKNWISDRE